MSMKALTVIRLLSFSFFLYHTISVQISWMSLLSGILVFVSLYWIKEPVKSSKKDEKSHEFITNPLKGKPRGVSEEDLSAEIKVKLTHDITQLVTYDATNCHSLIEFEKIKTESECVFAKKAAIWGNCDWNDDLNLEENIQRCVPTFVKFVLLCPYLGLDGFVVMVPGETYAKDIQIFGDAVRRVLTVFSDKDPAGVHCMRKSYINRKGWVFQFNRCTMFVTTFAPFYSESHSRYSHKSREAFILFQPELSFAQHDIPPDTPETNWDNPRTVRDRIRVAFKKMGREYEIRDTIHYPMAEDIVKGINGNDNFIEWWKKDVGI